MTFKTLIFKEKDGLGNVVFCCIGETADRYKNYLTSIPRLFSEDTTAEGLAQLGVDMSELELVTVDLQICELHKLLSAVKLYKPQETQTC